MEPLINSIVESNHSISQSMDQWINQSIKLLYILAAQRFQDESKRSEITSIVDDFIHQQRLGDDLDMFEDRYVSKIFVQSINQSINQSIELLTLDHFEATEVITILAKLIIRNSIIPFSHSFINCFLSMSF